MTQENKETTELNSLQMLIKVEQACKTWLALNEVREKLEQVGSKWASNNNKKKLLQLQGLILNEEILIVESKINENEENNN